MDEFINRQVAIEQAKAEWAKLPLSETTGFGILMRVLTSIPAADVRPVRVGKLEKYGAAIRCSVCGFDTQSWDVNFCPYCGAVMMEES